MAIKTLGAKDVQPHEDYGFFGPDSITWKVWSYPTSLTIGFQRAVVVEELDPALVASVTETHAIFDRPRTRYDRTLKYFALVAFGSSRETSRAADILVKIHSKGIGTCPVTGIRYDANDPDSQLWIHITAWQSILLAYERYGPGRLSPEEEAQYWRECAVAAELQTCDQAEIPRNRDEVRAYYERMRPQMLASGIAKDAMNQLLDARVMLPKMPWFLAPGSWVAGVALRKGTIATLPQWMREESGLQQSRLMDALIRPVLRIAFWVVALNGPAQVQLLRLLSPMTVAVAAPILLRVPPERQEVLTPAEARERYGYDRPRDAHLTLRSRQHEKVFGEGGKPSEEGIIESQPILGRI
ncbi:oxygenase MpaB family protein [Nocardioides stalactiti]|uniref:oxygenase MpaB family protein n=1 Tax=Nocardioides stalactiti TaxID=2755356 RepID=UPI001604A06B|nr:oxygenase MpaB family protein [Nocardioides stalactiti]